MKLRFIEYLGDIYIVLGITYDNTLDYPDCFVVVPLEHTFSRSLLNLYTSKIPLVFANEISDEATLRTLMVLYGK